MGSCLTSAAESFGRVNMEIIKAIVEDTSLSPAEKVLFAILYCRKEQVANERTIQAILYPHTPGSIRRLQQHHKVREAIAIDVVD